MPPDPTSKLSVMETPNQNWHVGWRSQNQNNDFGLMASSLWRHGHIFEKLRHFQNFVVLK